MDIHLPGPGGRGEELELPTGQEALTPLRDGVKKYSFAGMEANSTIVTVGFYEGINELYLKISQ